MALAALALLCQGTSQVSEVGGGALGAWENTPRCPSGTYGKGADCSPCKRGKYSTGRALKCKSCPAGTFSLWPGDTSSKCGGYCEAGKYSPASSHQCTTCPAGYYGDRKQQADCARCPPGRFGEKGATNPNCAGACQVGYYGSGSSIECSGPCPRGKFSRAGAASCSNCPAGKWSGGVEFMGQFSCDMCQPGFHGIPGKGGDYTAHCAGKCAPGRYNDLPGQTACKGCAAGHFQDHEGEIFCRACPSGYYQPRPAKIGCIKKLPQAKSQQRKPAVVHTHEMDWKRTVCHQLKISTWGNRSPLPKSGHNKFHPYPCLEHVYTRQTGYVIGEHLLYHKGKKQWPIYKYDNEDGKCGNHGQEPVYLYYYPSGRVWVISPMVGMQPFYLIAKATIESDKHTDIPARFFVTIGQNYLPVDSIAAKCFHASKAPTPAPSKAPSVTKAPTKWGLDALVSLRPVPTLRPTQPPTPAPPTPKPQSLDAQQSQSQILNEAAVYRMRAAKAAAKARAQEKSQAAATKKAEAKAAAAAATAAAASAKAELKTGRKVEASILLIFTAGSICAFISLAVNMASSAATDRSRDDNDEALDDVAAPHEGGGYGAVANEEDPEAAADALREEEQKEENVFAD